MIIVITFSFTSYEFLERTRYFMFWQLAQSRKEIRSREKDISIAFHSPRGQCALRGSEGNINQYCFPL